jgi:O-antigen/teichoic acid export membrane protein
VTGAARLARNTGLLSASELVIKLFTLTFFMLLARRLGVEGMGRWTYAFTFVSLFMNLFNFGLATLFTREAAAHPELSGQLLGKFLPLRTVMALIALAVLLPVAWAGRRGAAPGLVLVFGLALAGSLVSDLLRSVFRARQRMQYDAALNIAERGLSSIFGSIALALGLGLLPTAAAWASGMLVALGLAILLARGQESVGRMGLSLKEAGGLLRQAAPLFLLGVLATLYFRQDVLLLRWLRSERETGLYGAAYRLLDMLVFLPGSLALAYLPAAAAARRESPEKFEALCRRALAITFSISVPLAVVLGFRAEDVIRALFGEPFVPAAPAARILVWTLVFFFANPVLGNTLIAGNLQRLPALAVGLGVVLNGALNLFLIPRLGIVGAAWSTLITEGALFLVQGTFVARRLVPMNLFAPLVKPGLAGLVLAGAMWLLRGTGLPLALGAGLLVYAGLGLLLGLWHRSEWNALLPGRLRGETG